MFFNGLEAGISSRIFMIPAKLGRFKEARANTRNIFINASHVFDDVIHSDASRMLNTSNSAEDSLADSMAEALKHLRWPSSSDANIIFYVSGAMARSVVRITRCEHCKEELVNPDPLAPIEMDEVLDYGAATLLEDVNRGGLTRPSDYTFELAINCWRVFEAIKSSSSLKAQLLAAECQRSLFVKIIDRVTDISNCGQPLVSENFCVRGHDLKLLLVQRLFNCFAKNAIKQLNTEANEGSRQPAKRRKIIKLSSSSSKV